MVTKITNITVMDNGNISPNSVIKLGNKYENVRDALVFKVPWDDPLKYSCYISLKMGKKETIFLPIVPFDTEEGKLLTLLITTTITKNAGIYDMVFVASDNDNLTSLDDAKENELIFVSNVFQGKVDDNFLQKEMELTGPDDQIKFLYGQMLSLYNVLEDREESDYYKGDYFYPSIDPVTYELSWQLIKGQDTIDVPPAVNIRGEQGAQGPYYIPQEELVDGKMGWNKSQEDMVDAPALDFGPTIETTVNNKLAEEDEEGETLIDKAINSKFKWSWDPETQTLFIETEDLETTYQDVEGVEF